MHVLVQAFYFSISTMIMNVHVHGARCPNFLACSSVLFAGWRVGDITEDLEAEADSMEIETIDHNDPSIVLHAISKATATQTVCIKIRPT